MLDRAWRAWVCSYPSRFGRVLRYPIQAETKEVDFSGARADNETSYSIYNAWRWLQHGGCRHFVRVGNFHREPLTQSCRCMVHSRRPCHRIPSSAVIRGDIINREIAP